MDNLIAALKAEKELLQSSVNVWKMLASCWESSSLLWRERAEELVIENDKLRKALEEK